jgi:hypothetical protein
VARRIDPASVDRCRRQRDARVNREAASAGAASHPFRQKETPIMAVKLNSLRADMRRQNDGDWIDIPDLPDGDGGCVAFHVRGANYGPFQQENSLVRSRWVRRYGSVDAVPPEVSGRDLAHLYSKHLLLGWRGFDLEHSHDLAEEMMREPGEFFGHVLYAVAQVMRRETEFVETASKNSPSSSAGSSATAQA